MELIRGIKIITIWMHFNIIDYLIIQVSKALSWSGRNHDQKPMCTPRPFPFSDLAFPLLFMWFWLVLSLKEKKTQKSIIFRHYRKSKGSKLTNVTVKPLNWHIWKLPSVNQGSVDLYDSSKWREKKQGNAWRTLQSETGKICVCLCLFSSKQILLQDKKDTFVFKSNLGNKFFL